MSAHDDAARRRGAELAREAGPITERATLDRVARLLGARPAPARARKADGKGASADHERPPVEEGAA
jgi:hypothetical protein